MSDSSEQLLDNKLYVRVLCSVCFGTKNNRNGGTCPYCDATGRTYIGASIKMLKQCLTEYSESDKKLIQAFLKKDNNA